jgi:hypothetical protein
MTSSILNFTNVDLPEKQLSQVSVQLLKFSISLSLKIYETMFLTTIHKSTLNFVIFRITFASGEFKLLNRNLKNLYIFGNFLMAGFKHTNI